MARKLTTREIVLVVGLAVVAVAVLWFRDEGGLFGGGGEKGRELAPLGQAPRVNTDRLIADAEAFDATGRNLFQFYTPPPPPRQARKAPPPTKPNPSANANRKKTVRRPAPPPQARGPRPPNVDFEYLGYLGPKDDKIAVFEKGEELEQARVGEVILEQFRLLEFKYEAVVIGYVDNRFRDQSTELKMSR